MSSPTSNYKIYYLRTLICHLKIKFNYLVLWLLIICQRIMVSNVMMHKKHQKFISTKCIFNKCQLPLLLFLCFYLLLFFIVVQVQLSPLPPNTHPRPTHPHLPPLVLPSLALSMCALCMFLDDPSPTSPHYSSPLSPLVTVNLFFISMTLVIFCLLVCFVGQVPIIHEIIWYLSFTSWLISLSIMLSSSIYAVANDRRSFFLSAVQYSIV